MRKKHLYVLALLRRNKGIFIEDPFPCGRGKCGKRRKASIHCLKSYVQTVGVQIGYVPIEAK